MDFLLYLVAGPGFAPGPGGYEPPELLLLHPAKNCGDFQIYSNFILIAIKVILVELNVGVAQLVEHGTHKPGVVGSIPTSDTRIL